MTARRLLAAAALILAATPLAVAAQQRHNSAAPIDFGADHIELQDKAHRTILSGNVSVKQAEMTLNAARMTVNYAGDLANGATPEAQRIDAAGGPRKAPKQKYLLLTIIKRFPLKLRRLGRRISPPPLEGWAVSWMICCVSS